MNRLAFVLLLFAAPLRADAPEPPKADAPTVKIPAEINVQPGAWFSIVGETTGGQIAWLIPDTALTFEPAINKLFQDRKENIRVFVAPKTTGRYRVWAGAAKDSVIGKFSECTIVVGDAPIPPGPIPPGPGPGPAPIPGDGLRVLIVYDSATLSALPKEQISMMYGGELRGYLNTHCAKGPDGKTPEWRIWAAEVPTGAESKTWQDAMARKRDKLPWLIVAKDGKLGFEGPLPTTTAETMKIITPIGGN